MANQVENYIITNEITFTTKKRVCHGIRSSDNCPVVLKILNKDYANPQNIAQLRHEQFLLNKLKIPRVIRAYGVEKFENSYALILEDIPNAETLTEVIERNEIDIKGFLTLAIAITEALNEVHTNHIIHKDINPNNIIVTHGSETLKLIDFSIATLLSKENPEIKSPDALEGTLPYISPEQTGRMSRLIDKRSDLYSLGITFHQMLTGKLPFEAKDPIEWVHCHIAKIPKSLHELNPAIPEAISDIVMKLLSKAAEDRYNSATSLLADLKKCATMWDQQGKISPFKLAEQDHGNQFYIPQKLYGREAEVSTLLSTFEQVKMGQQKFLLVTGQPGIGKSSLVNEIHKPITEQFGYYTFGKFEQFKHNMPYFGLAQAFQNLIQQFLTESSIRVTAWRERILRALGTNGQVLIDVIPDLEKLIGKQPSVVSLSASSAQNRFELVFFDFIHTLSSKEHPLVIFLDDLQWIDYASLNLLEKLATQNTLTHFLFVGAYREKEIKPSHPIHEMIHLLEERQVLAGSIHLNTLTIQHVVQLIQDTLNSQEDVSSLANLVLEKTGGNPFFIKTFLTKLHHEGYLFYESNHMQWSWNMQILNELDITDNVVDLVLSDLRSLSPETHTILKIAACVGSQFDIQTLSWVSQYSNHQVASILWELAEKNLIIPLEEKCKLAIADHQLLSNRGLNAIYKFAHDQIQKAISTTLTPEELKQTNLNLGRLMLAKTHAADLEDKTFEIVNHFDSCLDLIKDAQEKRQIISLNLQAGQKAKQSAAYNSAAMYFAAAITLLGENEWDTDYNLAWEAHLNYAECIHLSGNFDEAKEKFNTLISLAKGNRDKAKIMGLMSMSYTQQMQYQEALQTGLSALRILGIDIKLPVSQFTLAMQFIKILSKLRGNTLEKIAKLPVSTQIENKMIMEIYRQVSYPAYLTDVSISGILTLKVTEFLLQQGYTVESLPLLLNFTTSLISGTGNYKLGLALASHFVNLSEKSQNKFIQAHVLLAGYALVNFWGTPFTTCVRELKRAYQLSREIGDVVNACMSAISISTMDIIRGISLSEANHKIAHMKPTVDFLKNPELSDQYNIIHSITQVLLNEMPIAELELTCQTYLSNQPDSTSKMVETLKGIYLLIPICILEKWNLAKQLIDKIHPVAESPLLSIVSPITQYYYFKGLTLLHFYPYKSLFQKYQYRKQLRQILKKFSQWEKLSTENFSAMAAILHMQYAFIVENNVAKCYTHYQQAIDYAEKSEHNYHLAYANECLAQVYISLGQNKSAIPYFQEAFHYYKIWDAKSKYDILCNTNNTLIKTLKHHTIHKTISGTSTISQTGITQELDLSSVMKSTQAIASNVKLDELLRALILILMENAGAERGLLLLKRRDELYIEAESVTNEKSLIVLQHHRFEDFSHICHPIVQYVRNTKQSFVLANALHHSSFNHDSYIIQNKTRSILCSPIIYQNELLGVVYLENNLISDAFTANRLELIRLISSQAAISLENALYNAAYNQFIPHEFLELLSKRNIIDIQLGDYVQKNMTVLFSDIRQFTTLSEKLPHHQLFELINGYLSVMEPIIKRNGGFIDKYIGDAIMVLFDKKVDAALTTAIEMQHALMEFNKTLRSQKLPTLKIGIGLNYGKLILGTIGSKDRLETSVLSDVVNIASRTEDLTKDFHAKVLITDAIYKEIKHPEHFHFRFIGKVKIRGKSIRIKIWEEYSSDPANIFKIKLALQHDFNRAIELFRRKQYRDALFLFQAYLERLPNDRVSERYIRKCHSFLKRQ